MWKARLELKQFQQNQCHAATFKRNIETVGTVETETETTETETTETETTETETTETETTETEPTELRLSQLRQPPHKSNNSSNRQAQLLEVV